MKGKEEIIKINRSALLYSNLQCCSKMEKKEIIALGAIFGALFLFVIALLCRYLCRMNAALSQDLAQPRETNKPVDDGEEFDAPVEQFHEIARGKLQAYACCLKTLTVQKACLQAFFSE